MLGSLILYLKGMRRMMFQLSGFYYKGSPGFRGSGGCVGSGIYGAHGFRVQGFSWARGFREEPHRHDWDRIPSVPVLKFLERHVCKHGGGISVGLAWCFRVRSCVGYTTLRLEFGLRMLRRKFGCGGRSFPFRAT